MNDTPHWDYARQEADRLSSLYSAPPIPVLEIAENSGVDVVIVDFGESKYIVAGFCDFSEKKLYVNSEDRLSRQTFTIAHELGHWVLHRHLFEKDREKYKVLPRHQKSTYNSTYEKEANFFAANLLVPSRLLLPVKDAPVSVLASIFLVSHEMMENRLKNVR